MRAILAAAAILVPGAASAANLSLSPGDELETLISGLQAGDTATLADGVYPVDGTVRLNGILATEGSPTVVRAAEGASPVIELMGSGWIVEFSGSSHVRLEGLTLRGGGDFAAEERSIHGINIHDDSTDITVVGNTIVQITGDAIRSSDGVGLVIRGNEVSQTSGGIGLNFGTGDGSSWLQDSVVAGNYLHDLPREAVYFGPGCFGNRVVDNVIHAIPNQNGIVLQSTDFGAPNVVEGNAIWDGGANGVTVGGSAIVRNNVIFNVASAGIRAVPTNAADYDDVVISFNTVADTGNDGLDIRDWAGHTGMVLANNVVANPTGNAMEAEEGDWDDGNLIVGNIVTGLVRGFEELAGHFVSGHGHGDFQDAPAWDFYPSSASTLRDSADPSGATFIPEVDFNGLPRQASAPDVGAYEFGEASNPGSPIREGFKQPPPVLGDDAAVDGCEGCAGEEEGAAAAFLPMLLLAGLGLGRRRLRL